MKMKIFLKIAGLFVISSTFASTPSSPVNLHSAPLGRLLLGLVIVLIFIFVLSWVLKRLNNAKLIHSPGFKMIAGMNLGVREKIILVSVGERILLLGVTAHSINTLHDFGEEIPKEFISEGKTSFSTFLKTALGKTDK